MLLDRRRQGRRGGCVAFVTLISLIAFVALIAVVGVTWTNEVRGRWVHILQQLASVSLQVNVQSVCLRYSSMKGACNKITSSG